MYRIGYGSEPVVASFDFDSGNIGPYHCGHEFKVDPQECTTNKLAFRNYFEILQRERISLAVWNLNNCAVVSLSEQHIQIFLPGSRNPDSVYPISNRIVLPDIVHIGYKLTHVKCKTIYHWPWYVYMDKNTKQIIGTNLTVSGNPQENPSPAIYKELLAHPGTSMVYVDKDTGNCVFL